MRSSYIQNDYGKIFEAIVDAFKPRICVELGVLDGYSAVHIARGLKKNNLGHLDAYDLFDLYPHNHGSRLAVKEEIALYEVEDWVTLYQEDAYEVHKKYMDNVVYLLHVDISNTGETVKKIMEQWDSKMVIGGIILFEGGTEERDQVEWMVKYNKPSLKKELEENPIIEKNYIFATYLKYPGLTCLLKKR